MAPRQGVPADRVLIVRLSALGDTALTLPMLFLLRQQLPELFIGWVVGEAAAPLLQGLPELDRVHVWRSSARNPAGLWHLAKELRDEHYDVALDPQGITRSSALPWLARIPKRLGFRPGLLESRELAPLLIDATVDVPSDVTHISRRTLFLAAAIGADPRRWPEIRLPVHEPSRQRIRTWLNEQVDGPNPLVLGIGAGWPTRVWPVEKVARLALTAARYGGRPVVLWGPYESGQLAHWRQVLGRDALFAPKTDVLEMIELLRCCRGYAGPDSAPLHLAWLLGRPTFGWFGASDPRRCAPPGDSHRHVAQPPHDWRRWSLREPALARLEPEAVLPVFERWLTTH